MAKAGLFRPCLKRSVRVGEEGPLQLVPSKLTHSSAPAPFTTHCKPSVSELLKVCSMVGQWSRVLTFTNHHSLRRAMWARTGLTSDFEPTSPALECCTLLLSKPFNIEFLGTLGCMGLEKRKHAPPGIRLQTSALGTCLREFASGHVPPGTVVMRTCVFPVK